MLDTLPPDVLEHVAYFASTHALLGPPTGLLPLLALCRSTSATLRRSANPHLYARIFTAKFDLAAPRRRLARLCEPDTRSILSVNALADELVRRFTVLRRLHDELDARSSNNESGGGTATDEPNADTEASTRLDEVLWTAFLMVLEDGGRNTAQLRNARVEAWLAVFWFDPQGASGAVRALAADRWPVAPSFSKDSKQKTRHALAMWLLWFFLDPAAYVANPDLYRRAERILKLVALNASLYPLSHLPWTSFTPEPSQIHIGAPGNPSTVPFDPRAETVNPQHSAAELPFTHFTHALPRLTPLPPAAPANLALLALHTRSRRNADTLDGGLELLELLGPSLAEAFIALPERTRDVNREWTRNSCGGQSDGETDVTGRGWIESQQPSMRTDSYRWESEWLRCVYAVDGHGFPFRNYGTLDLGVGVTSAVGGIKWKRNGRRYKTYQPGSLEGSWEGTFTYTDFHVFAALLAGASPLKLQDCLLAQHSQTWRVREYHLLSPPNSSSSHSSSSSLSADVASTSHSFSSPLNVSPKNGMTETPIPLPVGDAILAHIPEGVAIEDDPSWLRMTLPSSYTPPPTSSPSSADPLPSVYTYTRYRGPGLTGFGEDASEQREGHNEEMRTYTSRVLDIVLRGEGHSGWGEFRLLGRVRPADGFITIMKEYTGGDRGRWLYRGYLVGGGSGIFEGEGEGQGQGRGEGAGGSKGYMVGRWRDTLTPAETHGYEGAFAMARRR